MIFARKRKIELPEVKLPKVELPDVKVPEVRLREVELPDIRLPDVKLPDVRVPEVKLPDIQVPEVRVPSFRVPEMRTPEVRIPEIRVPEVRTPELELTGQAPFVRRRRSNPIVRGLKFVAGATLGLIVGTVAAALLAPAAGEDTRRKIAALRPGSGGASDEATTTLPVQREEAVVAYRAAPTAEPAGIVDRIKARYNVAVREARLEREQKQQQLVDRLHTAQRTGHVPETPLP